MRCCQADNLAGGCFVICSRAHGPLDHKPRSPAIFGKVGIALRKLTATSRKTNGIGMRTTEGSESSQSEIV